MGFAALDNSNLDATQKVDPVEGERPDNSYLDGKLIQGLSPASAAVFGISGAYFAGIAVA